MLVFGLYNPQVDNGSGMKQDATVDDLVKIVEDLTRIHWLLKQDFEEQCVCVCLTWVFEINDEVSHGTQSSLIEMWLQRWKHFWICSFLV